MPAVALGIRGNNHHNEHFVHLLAKSQPFCFLNPLLVECLPLPWEFGGITVILNILFTLFQILNHFVF